MPNKKMCPLIKSDCVEHKCAMWRGETIDQSINSIREQLRVDGSVYTHQEIQNDWAEGVYGHKYRGYCGLAGQKFVSG